MSQSCPKTMKNLILKFKKKKEVYLKNTSFLVYLHKVLLDKNSKNT